MIEWTNDPGEQGTRNRWHIQRVGRAGQIMGIFVATAHVGVFTHYVSNRTQPCRGDDCEGCRAKQRREWHAYIPVFNASKNVQFMLELTARAAEPIIAHVNAGKSLRGWTFKAWRIGPKINSPVDVQLIADESAKYQLPSPPNIIECLLKTWRLQDDPTARIAAPKTTTVREHKRRKDTSHEGSEKLVQANGTEHPGGLGSANGVHQPTEKITGRISPSAPTEPTID